MGSLTIRKLDDEIMDALRRRGAARNSSMEDEARRILSDAVKPGRAAYWERMEKRRASYGKKRFSDSAEIIRQERDRRTDKAEKRS